MSGLLSELGASAASLPAEAVAFALGLAAGRALEAPATEIGQEAWKTLPIKAVDPETAAGIVAEDVELEQWGEDEAAQSGINSERFQAIVGEVLNAPGLAELLAMTRRGTITADDLTHGFRKLKLETRWDDHLAELQHARAEPAVLADAIQRRVLPDPGYLENALPVEGSNVPILSVSGLDPVTEAAASGIDSARLELYTKIAGLPPAPGELLSLLNRGEINEAAFALGIAQGHTRNEWGPMLLALRRRLLTPHEYEEAALRGIITNPEADAGAALSGMTQPDAQLLFNLLGRPLEVHQITTGLARGGTYGGDYSTVPEPYQDAIRRSSIRPEYAHLAYANRYTYPSAFVLRALAQAGELGDETAVQTVLEEIGWAPTFAAQVARSWAPTGSVADPHVAKAQTQLWTAVHKSYVSDEIAEQVARDTLPKAGVQTTGVDAVLATWDAERALIRAQLTATQIKKAIGLPGKDKAWALARLLELGYDQADAETFLAE